MLNRLHLLAPLVRGALIIRLRRLSVHMIRQIYSDSRDDSLALCDILLRVLSQYLVDQRLVADPAPPSLLPELLEHLRVESNRD